MQPTDAQSKLIKHLRDTFGKDAITTHAPNATTGLLWIEAACSIGVWDWQFDADGNLAAGSLRTRLFEPPAREHKPRNAIDN